jgi:hypothetical protein
MTKLTEFAIEDFAINLLECLDYSNIHVQDIAPDGDKPVKPCDTVLPELMSGEAEGNINV